MKNIPNLLTTLRILLVPCFVYVYWTVPPEGFYWPIVLLALSGLTDVADGMIARKFNMITPLGRFLDPVADKLTIAAVVICLALRHPILWILFGIYAVKEIVLISIGFVSLKSWRNSIAAKWYGKAATVFLYVLMFAVMLFLGISNTAIVILMLPPLVFIILSFIFYLKEINHHKKQL